LKIRAKHKAIRLRYIQPNFPKILIYLMFDIDREGGAFAWEDNDLPVPTFIVVNPENAHAHLIYELLTPVLLWDNASPKPIAYLDAIRRGYASTLGADLGYSSLITKNPCHSHWRRLAYPAAQYSLGELADYVSLTSEHYKQRRGIREDYAALGRNCTLFEVGRIYAYDSVCGLNGQDTLYAVVLAYISTYNAQEFAEPLPTREVESVAKSISKWTWERRENFKGRSGRHRRKTTDEELKQKQIQSAHNTAEIKRAATEAKIKNAVEKFLREGRKITKAAIAREAGISREAASRYYSHLIPKV
jgi:hypothetical protein